jgi:predicted dehydrogenase
VKTRVAIVGLGKMGLMHASIMGMLDGVELVALCEKSPFIRKFGKKVLPSINMVADLTELSGENLDAVCVTTPPASHFPIIKQVYEAEIARNIFTEKPLATSFTQAQELCELAETHGGVNMVGYHRRCSVTFKKTRGILSEGLLGELSSFEGYAYSADFVGAKSAKQTIARGGVMEDSGCHVVDLALWLFGPMEAENASVKSLIGSGSEDEVSFTVKTPEALRGEFGASWCKEGYRLPEMGLTITGTSGTLRANEDMVELELGDEKPKVWYKHDLNDTVPFFIGGAEYQRQDELFIRAIRDGVDAEPSFRTASRVEELVEQVNKLTRGLKAE